MTLHPKFGEEAVVEVEEDEVVAEAEAEVGAEAFPEAEDPFGGEEMMYQQYFDEEEEHGNPFEFERDQDRWSDSSRKYGKYYEELLEFERQKSVSCASGFKRFILRINCIMKLSPRELGFTWKSKPYLNKAMGCHIDASSLVNTRDKN